MYWFQNDYFDFHFQPRHTKRLIYCDKKKKTKKNVPWLALVIGVFLRLKTPSFSQIAVDKVGFLLRLVCFCFELPQRKKHTKDRCEFVAAIT